MTPERFWENTQRVGACLVWTGCRTAGGYGRVRVANRTDWAHRTAYRLAVGAIPPGMFVCHRCDNPPCVEPTHLFLGTALDNNRDRIAKGRPGGGTPSLPWAFAPLVAASPEHPDVIAARFGVSRRTVYRIKDGSWCRSTRQALEAVA